MSEQPAAYSFLPWLRRGMATAITNPDGAGLNNQKRVEFEVKLAVTTDSGQKETQTSVSLYGPADVTGIDPRVIIRTEPVNNATDFESNYLAFVEFGPPDFPWRYTPAAASSSKTLRPWLFLIVLTEDEIEDGKVKVDPTKPLPWMVVKNAKNLPKPDQTWAWAHTQVLNKIDEKIGDVLSQSPKRFLSRIMCPRKLKPKQSYTAFLVPTFATGRLAGLGKEIPRDLDGLEGAWTNNDRDRELSVELPVYYSFRFSSGVGGDFESLVTHLNRREMPKEVGIRDIDVSNPGHYLPSATDDGIMGLEGPLKAPSTEPKPLDWKGQNATHFKEELKKILNAPADAIDSSPTSDKLIVSPPIYGSSHASVKRVDPTNISWWINELNLDPRNRAAAGLGAMVIRDQQDKLMASAWKQLSDIERINQTLRQAQLAREVSKKNFEKIQKLPDDSLLMVTSPVYAKILGSSTTIRQHFKESTVPDAALSPALRSIARLRGPVRKRQLGPSPKPPVNMLSRINRGEITAAPKRKQPDKIAKMNSQFEKLTPEVIESAPPRPDFKLQTLWSDLGSPQARPVTPGQDSPEAKEFRQAASELQKRLLMPKDIPITKKPVDIASLHGKVLAAIDPSVTIAASLKRRLKVAESFHWSPEDPIEPILAAPTFPQAMYEALRDMSQDYLLPGLDKIPNNIISILLPNQQFIEAYMVGLNHEVARELLWREYPTDMRGSLFRQFWDVRGSIPPEQKEVPENKKDITEIHRWKSGSKLGEHSPRQMGAEEDLIVLLVRGDLFRRYPNSVVYAVKAVENDDLSSEFTRKLTTPEKEPEKKRSPMFRGTLFPDVTFFAFDLTEDEARGSDTHGDMGWYFVIQEQPSAPRFGLHEDSDRPFKDSNHPLTSWDDLSWNSIVADEVALDELVIIDIKENEPFATTSVRWGSNSSDMAYILFRKPMRIAIHAEDMLPPRSGGP